MVYNSKPFAYLLACLKNGLIIHNHLLTCLLEKWFNNSKPLFAYLLFEIWFYNFKPLLALNMVLQLKTICLLFKYGLNQNHLLALKIMVFQFKTIKYQCKTVYNNNTLVFEKWV